MNLSPSRLLAIQVVYRVRQDNAYAARCLDAELEKAKLSAQDAALCTEIVYGTLRVFPELETMIDAALSRGRKKLDAYALVAMAVAAYQLKFLDRVPAYAVVNDTVNIVRKKRGDVLARFTNAVLRRMAKTLETKADTQSSAHPPSIPTWLHEKLIASLGEARTMRFLHPTKTPPNSALRIWPERVTPQSVMDEIRALHPDADVHLSDLMDQVVVARHAGNLRDLKAYHAGGISIQEEGAQLISAELGVSGSAKVADVCAGHGGKTIFFAKHLSDEGHVTAIDLYETKLKRIEIEAQRLGINPSRVDIQTIDMSVGPGGMGATYSHVMVDAPCTGIGTIHRRPELLLRLKDDAPLRMQTLQLSILTHAAELVAPFGTLAYAVCSPLKEEGIDVVELFERHIAHRLKFERRRATLNPKLCLDDDAMLRIGPWTAQENRHSEPDAYQLMVWKLS